MTFTKKIIVGAASATMLLAPAAAFATPVALGGNSTRGAHAMSRHSMMKKKMMMRKQMMMKKGMMKHPM